MSIFNNTTSLQELLEVANNLPEASTGVELPELSNPANADEIFLNKEVIDENGEVKTGTFTIDNEINTQEVLLSNLREALNGKTASSGEQVTPVISVNSSGLITATAGTKSATKQLAFQAAKTITPSTMSQIAVSSGYYTGGNITVNPIPSQYVVPSGTLTITSNGTHDVKNYASATIDVTDVSSEVVEHSENEDAIIDGTLVNYINDRVLTIKPYTFYSISSLAIISFSNCVAIGSSAFAFCKKLNIATFPACKSINQEAFRACFGLATISFPECTSISYGAFRLCSSLVAASFPACRYVGSQAFAQCLNLTSITLPACSSLGYYAFASCSKLATITLPVCTKMEEAAFKDCYSLSSITIGTPEVCTLANSNAFSSTPYAGYSSYFSGTPHIYVPASLVSAYQSATNWTYFSSYFSAMEV